MKTTSSAAPYSPAACLGAAQSEAERLFGHGPVRLWRPAFDWRPWATGAALVAVATLALLWLWATGPSPERAPVAVVDHRTAVEPVPPPPHAAPVEAASATAAAVAAPGCDGVACTPRPASGEAPTPVADAAPVLALPENLEAWALDPQPLVAAADSHPSIQSLVNTPVIPDEFDPTPADESAPDDEPVEAPAE